MSSKKIIRVISPFICGFLISCLLLTSAIAQDGSTLVINYMESQPVEGKFEYDVSVFFSLADSTGNPIKDLKLGDITISEDGQNVIPGSLDLVTDQSIYVSLLLDTSGSMRGSKNEAMITAAQEFVNSLQEEDLVSITTFNNEVKTLVDFSRDHTAAANLISSVEAVANAGTCIYDSAYEAVEKTAALPLGRRAVILLTDGKDELLEGGACSKLTIDDVINIATEGNVRVPIFTIGIGDSVDDASLSRISQLTGGMYLNTPDPTKLNVVFNQLSDLLQSQYILHYISTSAPGNHTVVINADHLNGRFTDSHGFILPVLPLNLSIISPVQGQQITDKTMIVTVLNGQGESIKEVLFILNDTIISSDSTTPYEFEWQPDSGMTGEYTLLVKAISENESELASDSVSISIATPEETESEGLQDPPLIGFDWKKYLPYAGGILLVIFSVIGLIFILKSYKKRALEKQRDAQWNQMVVNPPSAKDISEESTMDGFLPNPNALGALTVLQSDDPAMIGKRFEIFNTAVRIGRAEDNEIRFAKDTPVSRRHAIIENKNDQLVISEMVTPQGDGTVKSPTFGTFINEIQISRATPLQNGDFIKLGKRVVLRFESSRSDMENDAKTIDQFNLENSDKTIDSF